MRKSSLRMAQNPHSILAFLFILNILLAIAGHAVAGRDIPNSKNVDKKQPEWFIGHDGSVLIPGIGRVMLPRKGSSFNPFTYNPVTGTGGGTGSTGGNNIGSGGGATPSYIPGGDDTFVPNPGFEVPYPGSGGSVPGGDGTFVPNPGVQVPNPGSGGSIPGRGDGTFVPNPGVQVPNPGSGGSVPGGGGVQVPIPGSGGSVPGGDDTFVPNPGVEVPNPGTGGSIPAAARP